MEKQTVIELAVGDSDLKKGLESARSHTVKWVRDLEQTKSPTLSPITFKGDAAPVPDFSDMWDSEQERAKRRIGRLRDMYSEAFAKIQEDLETLSADHKALDKSDLRPGGAKKSSGQPVATSSSSERKVPDLSGMWKVEKKKTTKVLDDLRKEYKTKFDGMGKSIANVKTKRAILDLKKGIRGIKKPLTSVEKQARKTGSGLGKFAKGALAGFVAFRGVTGVVSTIKEGIAVTEKFAKTQRGLTNALERNGKAAGFSRQQLSDITEALDEAVGAPRTLGNELQTMLAAFDNVKGEEYKDALMAAFDVTEVLGGNVETRLKTIASALDAPTEAAGKLRSVGITLTAQQKEQIEAMTNAGKTAEAQQLILEQLQGAYGGAAEASGGSARFMAGAMENVSIAVGKLVEPIKNDISEALLKAAEYTAHFATIAAPAFEYVYVAVRDFYNAASVMIGRGLYEAIMHGVTGIQVGFSAIGDIITATGSIIGLGVVSAAEDIKHAFTVVIPEYMTWFGNNWQNIIGTVAENTVQLFKNLGENVSNLWSAILGVLSGEGFNFEFKSLTDGFINAIEPLPKIAARVMTETERELAKSAANAGGSISEKYQKQLAKNRKAVGDFVSDFAMPKKSILGLDGIKATDPSAYKDKDANKDKEKKEEEGFSSSKQGLEAFGLQVFGDVKDKTTDAVKEQTDTIKSQHTELVAAVKGQPQNSNKSSTGGTQNVQTGPSGNTSGGGVDALITVVDNLRSELASFRDRPVPVTLER